MRIYRVVLDVYNSRPEMRDGKYRYAPSQRVTLLRKAISPEYAVRDIGTVYVSADGDTVNTAGGVGRDGYYYPEWEIVSVRLSRAKVHAL